MAAAAGPFAGRDRPGTPVTVRLGGPGGIVLAPMTLAGRDSAGGPVDDLTLVAGHWARQAGQIVLRFGYQGGRIRVGSWLTVTGLPGASRLKVVGLAVSISGSADAWVVPAEIARLRSPGTPGTAQMLYRFDGAATAAAIDADVAAVSAALPAGAVTGTRSYLTVKAADAEVSRPACRSDRLRPRRPGPGAADRGHRDRRRGGGRVHPDPHPDDHRL